MTLLGVMVVLLFSSMKICAESWQKGEDKISGVNDIAVVYQFFQHHLAAAKPVWDDFSQKDDENIESNKEFAFQGKSQELRFVSAFPASAKKSGSQFFSLNLTKDGDEQVIQVSIKPFYPVSDGEEWRIEEVTLLRHVRNFSLSYFGKDEAQSEDMDVWREDWLDQETLPRLVKVKIERDDGSFWPEMVFELKSEPILSNPDDQAFADETQPAEDPPTGEQ